MTVSRRLAINTKQYTKIHRRTVRKNSQVLLSFQAYLFLWETCEVKFENNTEPVRGEDIKVDSYVQNYVTKCRNFILHIIPKTPNNVFA